MTTNQLLAIFIVIAVPVVIAGLIVSYPIVMLTLASAASLLVGSIVVVRAFFVLPLFGGIAEIEGVLFIIAGVLFAGMAGGILMTRERLDELRQRRGDHAD